MSSYIHDANKKIIQMPGPGDEGISDTTKKKIVIRVSNPNK